MQYLITEWKITLLCERIQMIYYREYTIFIQGLINLYDFFLNLKLYLINILMKSICFTSTKFYGNSRKCSEFLIRFFTT